MIRVLAITPVKHIQGVAKTLNEIGKVDYLEEPSQLDVEKNISNYDAVFTNPNKSNVFLGPSILTKAKKLKFICTASTGTNHIDIDFAKQKGIEIISLTEERNVIDKVSSTAELAFTLMLTSLRKINQAYASVLNDQWDYLPYVGKQINCLSIGVIGYGRLGKMFAKYSSSFGAKVFVYDPYKKVKNNNHIQISSFHEFLNLCDIISIHVHVTEETTKMIDKNALSHVKNDVMFVNTSRGEIIDENNMVNFLKNNQNAYLAADVIANEVSNKKGSELLKYAKKSNQVLITPHIGGMTVHAQEIAYNHAARLLKQAIKNLN